jgi:hypothetical protein
MSTTSSSARPSPIAGRVGIHDFTFEACSGFTHVTARPVAQPPKAAFVTRLRSGQLPSQTARQLPDLSTITWMDSSSIGYPCLFGAHQLSEVLRTKCCFWAAVRTRTEAAAVRAMASGSQHETISAIKTLMGSGAQRQGHAACRASSARSPKSSCILAGRASR